MKKILISLLAAAVLSGCSKNEGGAPPTSGVPVPDPSAPISLSAGIDATSESKAAVSGTAFPASTENVFRLTAYAGAAAPSTDWSTAYFADEQVDSGAESALSLKTPQYYPANGDNVYFYAYAPAATSLTAGTESAAPVANYTLTGQEDIMAAQVITGIAKAATGTQSQPELEFTHKLMQVRFKMVKDASFMEGQKVVELKIKGVKTQAKLDIPTGELTFAPETTADLSLPITAGTNDGITAEGTTLDGCLMLEPGTEITVGVIAGDKAETGEGEITGENITYEDVKVTLSNGAAGVSHLVTFTFKRNSIVPTAAITDWTVVEEEGSTDIK